MAELDRLFQSGDAQGFADALRLHMNPTWMGKALELWKAGLLTSPGTYAANLIGNIGNVAIDVTTTGIAGGVVDPIYSKLTGKQRTVRAGEMGAQLAGMRSVLGDSLRRWISETSDAITQKPEALPGAEEFAKLKEGTEKDLVRQARKAGQMSTDPDIVGKWEGRPVGAWGGKFGTAVHTPFRLLDSADAFFKRIIGAGELFRQAHRDGVSRGLSGDTLSTHTEQFVREFYDAVDKAQGDPKKMSQDVQRVFSAVQLAAKRGTFQESYRQDWFGRASHHFQQLSNDIPAIQFLIPFQRTPANIARKSVELTPVGAIMPGIEALRGEWSVDHAERLSRAMIGSLIGGALLVAAKQGFLTGSGPSDANERREKEQSGWQPYSFALGPENAKTYVQFSRFEPVASIMSIVADLAEAKDETKAKGLGQKLLAGVTHAFTDKTFLQGLESFFTMWSDPGRYAETWAKGLAGTVVPAGVAAVARATDEKVRDTSRGTLLEQISSTIKARIPGLSKTLPERRTGLGEDVERQSGPLFRLLSPSQVTEDKQGPLADLEREMVRVHYVPKAPKPTFRITSRTGRQAEQVDLTPREEEVWKSANQRAAEAAVRLMQGPGWDQRPDTEEEGGKKSKEWAFKQVWNAYHDAARSELRKRVGMRLRGLGEVEAAS